MSIKEEHRVLVATRFEINDRSDSSYRTLFRLFSITVSATDQILTAITNNSPYKSLLTLRRILAKFLSRSSKNGLR